MFKDDFFSENKSLSFQLLETYSKVVSRRAPTFFSLVLAQLRIQTVVFWANCRLLSAPAVNGEP